MYNIKSNRSAQSDKTKNLTPLPETIPARVNYVIKLL